MLDWIAPSWTDILGFGTVVVCAFLAARRNACNFPIGTANNVVFIVLFVGAAHSWSRRHSVGCRSRC